MTPSTRRVILGAGTSIGQFNGLWFIGETSGQSLFDSSGNGNHLQLGSTVGADANDPSFSGGGAVFATNDYCVGGLIADPQNDFAVFVVANIAASAPAANETYFSMGNATDATQYIHLIRNTSGNLQSGIKNDAGTLVSSTLAAASLIPGIRLIKFQRQAGLFCVKDIASGRKSTNAAAPASPITFNKIGFGARLRDAADAFLNQSIYAAGIISRATSDREDRAIHRMFRAVCAQKGVVLS